MKGFYWVHIVHTVCSNVKKSTVLASIPGTLESELE